MAAPRSVEPSKTMTLRLPWTIYQQLTEDIDTGKAPSINERILQLIRKGLKQEEGEGKC